MNLIFLFNILLLFIAFEYPSCAAGGISDLNNNQKNQHKKRANNAAWASSSFDCEQSVYYSDLNAAIAERENWEDNLPVNLERAYNPHQFLATRSWKKYWNQWLKLLKKGRNFRLQYLKYSVHDKVCLCVCVVCWGWVGNGRRRGEAHILS